uniref:GW182 middle domain-containing protein n=1 Tax=Panagrolaimus sp. ES5 TaxID=591445 RepID=A0AC34FUE6_9BILA
MWSNENHSVRETDGDASSWTNMNPWSNNTQTGTTTASRSNGSQSSMTQSQGYSSVPMRQPSRSWDLHTHQQYHSGMNPRWGSNSNWSAANEGCTPPNASLNSPWNPSMVNGSEPKRNPGILHRSMTGPSQNWGHKVDQQTPWDMGSEQQQAAAAAATQEWNNSQKWNLQQQQQQQQYAWHQAEHSPEWGNGNGHQELGWNGGNPSEEVPQESGSPGAWPVKQTSESETDHGSNGNADMVWQDPNPKMKQKKLARDTGTAIWGDPESQKTISKIRHWKNPEAAAASGYQNGLENDWTTADHQPLQIDNGWGEPAMSQSKMWSIANAWSDLQDDSIPDMIIPKLAHALGTNNLLETLQNAATANPQLATQLSEQFQGAVNRNWVNQSIYTAQIIQNFATLHQLIKRMYKKENEVLQLRHHPPSQTTNSCKERILSEIQHTKNELAEIQRAICGMPPTPVTSASTPSDGQSRLQQWKKNGNAMAKHVELVNGRHHVASSLPCDTMASDAMMNTLINAAHHLSINAADNSLNNSWKQGSLEWSPPAARDDRRKSFEESGLSSVTSQLNADVQEFIPGKRWEYRDPNKITDDPNATPGSCKPNPLLTSAALRLQMNSSTTKDSISSPSSNSLHQNGWNTRMSSKQISNNSPMMSPNGEQPGVNENYIYLPHCWLLFQLDNNITEHQFQQICHHAGHMINFCMIGLKIACVKFNSNNVDLVIHRIKSEYQFNPEQFRIVSDEEFNNKMLKHTRYLPVNGYDSLQQHHQQPQPQHHQHQQQPPMMSHHAAAAAAPWNFVPQMYNDPTCQY